MNEGESLLRQIVEEPLDDDVRLVYADWLEDNGNEEQGQYLRSSVRGEVDDINVVRSGYPARGWLWAGEPLQNIEEARYSFKKGMVYSVALTLRQLDQYGYRLFGQHPILRVTLIGRDPELESGSWYSWWFRDSLKECIDTDDLPEYLFSRLPESLNKSPDVTHITERGTSFNTTLYTSGEEAMIALSVACVHWGRWLQDLPELAEDVLVDAYVGREHA